MSDSIVGKETVSYRKKRVPETTQGPSVPQAIAFAHKFAGGETSFNLLSLTLPTAEMPGFTNPSPSVLSGTGLASNPNALRLHLSTGTRLIPFDSFRVFGTNIVFVGALAQQGMPAGAVVYGEISALAANPVVVGDVRFQRKTYLLAAGQATLNVGFAFKVGVNLTTSDQIGDILVYRNGQQQFRNVGNAAASPTADGNYQEVDAGNGYGTTIVFNNAPPVGGAGDAIMVSIGTQVSSGQLQQWSELERLQGVLLAVANDVAQSLGNPVSNYLAVSPTELDRRAFGDQVLSLVQAVAALQANPVRKTAIMKDVKAQGTAGDTPTSNAFYQRVLNTLIDPAGIIQNASSFTGTGGTNKTFGLLPGTYRMHAAAVIRGVGAADIPCKLRLYNVTDSVAQCNGLSQSQSIANGQGPGQQATIMDDIFSISAAKTFSLDSFQSSSSQAPIVSSQGLEVYSSLEIEKIG